MVLTKKVAQNNFCARTSRQKLELIFVGNRILYPRNRWFSNIESNRIYIALHRNIEYILQSTRSKLDNHDYLHHDISVKISPSGEGDGQVPEALNVFHFKPPTCHHTMPRPVCL